VIPDYETLMLPILKALSDGQTWRTREIVARMGEDFELSEDEMREMIPSGRAKLIQNRVGWACTALPMKSSTPRPPSSTLPSAKI
jgi:restriction system protein